MGYMKYYYTTPHPKTSFHTAPHKYIRIYLYTLLPKSSRSSVCLAPKWAQSPEPGRQTTPPTPHKPRV